MRSNVYAFPGPPSGRWHDDLVRSFEIPMFASTARQNRCRIAEVASNLSF